MSDNPRIIAIYILQAVLRDGESLTRAEQRIVNPSISPQDRSLLRALCYGVLRWHGRLTAIATRLLEKPLKNKDQDINLLLLMGLYQLMEQRVPDYAAVSETVKAATLLKKPWAKGLLNGVLRNFSRQQSDVLAAVNSQPDGQFSFPEWLYAQIKKDWPDNWMAILSGSNIPAPLSLRVNRQKISVSGYLSLLEQHEIRADAVEHFSDAIQLQTACDVSQLPQFDQGYISVQDCAAQLAAELLAPQAGDRVLDACAAPGGKTGHLLEVQPEIETLFAIDSDKQRLQRVQENLKRLGYAGNDRVHLLAEDAGNIDAWWDGQLFDRILLDAPCSGTGVIRRHPDIKWLRRASDIETLVKTQAKLLRQLWALLKPGGVLLYATCSLLKAENEQQIQAFIKEATDAICEPLNLAVGVAQVCGVQLFPMATDVETAKTLMNFDGFYYARLKKQA